MFLKLRKMLNVPDVTINWKNVNSIGNGKFKGMTKKNDDGSYTLEYVADNEMLKTIVHELEHIKQWYSNQPVCCDKAEDIATKFVTRKLGV